MAELFVAVGEVSGGIRDWRGSSEDGREGHVKILKWRCGVENQHMARINTCE